MKKAIQNLIRRAFVTNTDADSDEVPISQVNYDEKTKDIEVIQPYGLFYNTPKEGIFLILNV